MRSKLFGITLKSNVIFAVLLIAMSIPAIYSLMQVMFLDDVDEALVQNKTLIVRQIERYGINSPKLNIHGIDILEFRPVRDTLFRDSFRSIIRHNQVSHEGEPYREYTTLIRIHGATYILSEATLIETEDLMSSLILSMSGFLVILLLGYAWISYSQSKKLWKPFYHTLDELKTYHPILKPDLSLEHTRIAEFDDLNQAIRELVQTSKSVFEQQKQFTENAAHELQTPLAILQSKMDLLLQTSNLDQDQASIMETIAESIQRISQLGKHLLLLAKIDNKQFVDSEPIQLQQCIQNALDLFEEEIETRQLVVHEEFHHPFEVQANPVLMEVLCSNLITNAIRHNRKKGTLQIMTDRKEMRICNSGVPLDFDANKLFDRFQKSSTDPRSLGLGLSIVRQICEVSHLKIAYSYLPAGMHQFRIYLEES